MRGSQRARDILRAMGEQAFEWVPITSVYGARPTQRMQRPLSARQIAQLKREHLMRGEQWSYEHIAPTALQPLRHPPRWPKGHKHDRLKQERQQKIAENMRKMPQWIAEAKARRQLPNDIPIMDQMLLSRKKLYEKYVKSRQRHQ